MHDWTFGNIWMLENALLNSDVFVDGDSNSASRHPIAICRTAWRRRDVEVGSEDNADVVVIGVSHCHEGAFAQCRGIGANVFIAVVGMLMWPDYEDFHVLGEQHLDIRDSEVVNLLSERVFGEVRREVLEFKVEVALFEGAFD